jgi:hypothetical protein
MRIPVRTFIPVALALMASPAWADDAAEARAIIEKAVQAVGGETKLAAAKAYTQKVSGTFHGPGGGVAFTGEWTVNLPDRLRQATESKSDGMEFRAVRVIDGDKGWLRVNNTVVELDKDALAAEREQMYAAWVASLLPLKEKDFALALLEKSQVGDRPAVGVQVTHKEHGPVGLYFGAEKGWLLKAEFGIKRANAQVVQEILYDDYQDADGLKRPRKTTVRRDRKVLVEAEVADFKPLDKPDPKLFEKP